MLNEKNPPKLNTKNEDLSRVKPACLPNPSFAPEKNGEVAAIVSGWGRLYEGNDHKNYSLNFYLHLIFDIL